VTLHAFLLNLIIRGAKALEVRKLRTPLSYTRFALTIICVLSPSVLLQGQQPTYVVPVEMKGQFLRGSVGVAQHENEGMIGINGKGTESGYKVETVTPGFPAAIVGILPGDIIVSMLLNTWLPSTVTAIIQLRLPMRL
jgi:hypothetical protein